jgi:hypothetical protein
MPRSLGSITPWEFETYGGQHHCRVVISDLGNGHREASITPYRTLADLPPGIDPCTGRWINPGEPVVRGEGDRDASQKRSRRRASKAVRERCKGSGFDSLFTFTFRENVQDREVLLEVWERVVRRLRRVLPGFAYVACVERQQRGALHLHVATHRLPARLQARGVTVKSWDLLRSIWREEAGPLGGNFDEAKRKKRSRASSFRIARYLAGYVAKDFDECPLNRKRYWAGGEWAMPRRVTMLFPAGPGGRISGDLAELVYFELVDDASEHSAWIHPDGHVLWLASHSPP